MKTAAAIALVLSALPLLGYAQAPLPLEVYRCINESGKPEYKNNGDASGCKKISLPIGEPLSKNWVDLSKQSGEYASYVDKDSFAITSTHRKAWILRSYDKHQKNSAGKSYQSDKILYLFKCKEKEAALSQIIEYSGGYGDGDVVDSYIKNKEDILFKEVIPDSVGAGLLRRICAFNPASEKKQSPDKRAQ